MTEDNSAFERLRSLLAATPPPQDGFCLRVLDATRGTQIAHSLRIAGSSGERSRGLLGRKSLEPGTGLWIVPCEAVHTFWMKFAIDLIYLDRELRIRKLRHSVPAWRISACFSAHSVLELPSGAIREAQAELGDRIDFAGGNFDLPDHAGPAQPDVPSAAPG